MLRRQTQHLLAYGVALDVVGAAADADSPLAEEILHPASFVCSVIAGESAVRAAELHHEIADFVREQRQRQLRDGTFRPGLLAFGGGRSGTIAEIFEYLRPDADIHDLLAYQRVIGRAEASSQIEEIFHRRSAAAPAYERSLVGKSGHYRCPAAMDFAQDVFVRDADIGEEHLVEVGDPSDLHERAHFNARRGHVYEEIGDASVLHSFRVAAGQQNAPVAVLRA